MRYATVVIGLWKLGDCQRAVFILYSGFRSCAAEWRAFIQEQFKVFRRFGIRLDSIGRIYKRRQMNQGRYTEIAGVMIK